MANGHVVINQMYTWYLLIYLSRYLDEETGKGPFLSSSYVATCNYWTTG